jgi:hypothetical protein
MLTAIQLYNTFAVRHFIIMKRIFLLICLVIFYLAANAQKIGVTAGLNSSNLGELDYEGYSYKNLLGFKAGILVDLPKRPIINIFSFETGIFFSGKNSKSTLTFNYFSMHSGYFLRTIDEITRLKYLELPLMIKPAFKIKKSKLFITLGAYYALGLKGTIETIENNDPYTREVTWNDQEADLYDFKRNDMGLIAGLGYERQSFQVSFSFERGLKNIRNSNYDIYSKDYTSSFNLILAYYIFNRSH